MSKSVSSKFKTKAVYQTVRKLVKVEPKSAAAAVPITLDALESAIAKLEDKQEDNELQKMIEEEEKKYKHWHVWQCDNPNCEEPNKPNCNRCPRCQTSAYCSKECQKMDWLLRHKLFCKATPKRIVTEIERIRNYIAILRNDHKGCKNIWADVYDEYIHGADTKVPVNPTPPPVYSSRRAIAKAAEKLKLEAEKTAATIPVAVVEAKTEKVEELESVKKPSAKRRGVVIFNLAEQELEPDVRCSVPKNADGTGTSEMIRDKRTMVWAYAAATRPEFLQKTYLHLSHLMKTYDPENSFVVMVISGVHHIEFILTLDPMLQNANSSEDDNSEKDEKVGE